jgi:hypothetical protein
LIYLTFLANCAWGGLSAVVRGDLKMGGSPNHCGRRRSFRNLFLTAASALALSACGGGADPSYQQAAMKASDAGDNKAATGLARKEVALYADQCSKAATLHCGTLALAYGTLAGYQIMDGDKSGGEDSFILAKGALSLTDPANRRSATAIVYRDVSEAFWKMGDRGRAIAIFKEGSAAGADQYLYMSSAARYADQQHPDKRPPERQPSDQQSPDQQQDQQPAVLQPDRGPTTAGESPTSAPEPPQPSPLTGPGPSAPATTRTVGTGTGRAPVPLTR